MEGVVDEKIALLKRKFHSGRHLVVRDLPPDAQREDIAWLLRPFRVLAVELSREGDEPVVLAYLETPDVLEGWNPQQPLLLRKRRVSVSPSLTDRVLCVSGFPLTYPEDKFAALVAAFGEVESAFLMISEHHGGSKGYGFVKFNMDESALLAKLLLHGLHLDGSVLRCEWLDPRCVTFESLHSKCLLVEGLNTRFRHAWQFRKLFSNIAEPIFCEIDPANGSNGYWAVVEYGSYDDAEKTLSYVSGFEEKPQISYGPPRVKGPDLFFLILNERFAARSPPNTPFDNAVRAFRTLIEKRFGSGTAGSLFSEEGISACRDLLNLDPITAGIQNQANSPDSSQALLPVHPLISQLFSQQSAVRSLMRAITAVPPPKVAEGDLTAQGRYASTLEDLQGLPPASGPSYSSTFAGQSSELTSAHNPPMLASNLASQGGSSMQSVINNFEISLQEGTSDGHAFYRLHVLALQKIVNTFHLQTKGNSSSGSPMVKPMLPSPAFPPQAGMLPYPAFTSQVGMPANPAFTSQVGLLQNPAVTSQVGLLQNPAVTSPAGMPSNLAFSPQAGLLQNPASTSQVGMPANPAFTSQVGMPPNPAYNSQAGMLPNPNFASQIGMPPNPAFNSQLGIPPNPAFTSQVGMPPNPAYNSQAGMLPNPNFASQIGMPPNPAFNSQLGIPPNPAFNSQPGMMPNPAFTSQATLLSPPVYNSQARYCPLRYKSLKDGWADLVGCSLTMGCPMPPHLLMHETSIQNIPSASYTTGMAPPCYSTPGNPLLPTYFLPTNPHSFGYLNSNQPSSSSTPPEPEEARSTSEKRECSRISQVTSPCSKGNGNGNGNSGNKDFSS